MTLVMEGSPELPSKGSGGNVLIPEADPRSLANEFDRDEDEEEISRGSGGYDYYPVSDDDSSDSSDSYSPEPPPEPEPSTTWYISNADDFDIMDVTEASVINADTGEETIVELTGVLDFARIYPPKLYRRDGSSAPRGYDRRLSVLSGFLTTHRKSYSGFVTLWIYISRDGEEFYEAHKYYDSFSSDATPYIAFITIELGDMINELGTVGDVTWYERVNNNLMLGILEPANDAVFEVLTPP